MYLCLFNSWRKGSLLFKLRHIRFQTNIIYDNQKTLIIKDHFTAFMPKSKDGDANGVLDFWISIQLQFNSGPLYVTNSKVLWMSCSYLLFHLTGWCQISICSLFSEDFMTIEKWNPSSENTQYPQHNVVHVAKPFSETIFGPLELSKLAELSGGFIALLILRYSYMSFFFF